MYIHHIGFDLRKLVFSIILIACILQPVSGRNVRTIRIWDGMSGVYKGRVPKLAVYEPQVKNGTALIICPGGSYSYLGMGVEGSEIAERCINEGITAFVLRYRTAGNKCHYPAMIEDIQRAIQIVRDSALVFGIDPDRVGVMGFSAGGHLAGCASLFFDNGYLRKYGLSDTDLKPSFSAMIYPVISMDTTYISHKKSTKAFLYKNDSPELRYKFTLTNQVRSDMPPIFLMCCDGDPVVNSQNSIDMDRALSEHGVNHAFHLFEGTSHGFGLDKSHKALTEVDDWFSLFILWLKEIM